MSLLEHIPQKSIDFFDQNMLQFFVLERLSIRSGWRSGDHRRPGAPAWA
jgi:hypothetical protein